MIRQRLELVRLPSQFNKWELSVKLTKQGPQLIAECTARRFFGLRRGKRLKFVAGTSIEVYPEVRDVPTGRYLVEPITQQRLRGSKLVTVASLKMTLVQVATTIPAHDVPHAVSHLRHATTGEVVGKLPQSS